MYGSRESFPGSVVPVPPLPHLSQAPQSPLGSGPSITATPTGVLPPSRHWWRAAQPPISSSYLSSISSTSLSSGTKRPIRPLQSMQQTLFFHLPSFPCCCFYLFHFKTFPTNFRSLHTTKTTHFHPLQFDSS